MNTDNLLLDPEEIMRVGKIWEDSWKKNYLETLSPEERLQGLAPEERLQGLAPEERLQGLDSETILNHLTPEQIEAYLQKPKSGKS